MSSQTLAFNVFVEKFLTPFCVRNLFWRQDNADKMYIDAKKDYECVKITHDFQQGYSHFTFRYTNPQRTWRTSRPDLKKTVSFYDIMKCNKVSFKRKHRIKLPQ